MTYGQTTFSSTHERYEVYVICGETTQSLSDNVLGSCSYTVEMSNTLPYSEVSMHVRHELHMNWIPNELCNNLYLKTEISGYCSQIHG